MAFDATVGGAGANSYVSVADADAYFTLRLNASEWTAADTATKQAALATATATIEEKFEWRGTKASDTQALHWPSADAFDCEGYSIDDSTIPQLVKNAVCEQALYLLKFDATQTPTGIMQGVSSASVGSVSATFSSSMTPEKLQSRIVTMIRCYGEPVGGLGGGMATSQYIVRG